MTVLHVIRIPLLPGSISREELQEEPGSIRKRQNPQQTANKQKDQHEYYYSAAFHPHIPYHGAWEDAAALSNRVTPTNSDGALLAVMSWYIDSKRF